MCSSIVSFSLKCPPPVDIWPQTAARLASHCKVPLGTHLMGCCQWNGEVAFQTLARNDGCKPIPFLPIQNYLATMDTVWHELSVHPHTPVTFQGSLSLSHLALFCVAIFSAVFFFPCTSLHAISFAWSADDCYDYYAFFFVVSHCLPPIITITFRYSSYPSPNAG